MLRKVLVLAASATVSAACAGQPSQTPRPQTAGPPAAGTGGSGAGEGTMTGTTARGLVPRPSDKDKDKATPASATVAAPTKAPRPAKVAPPPPTPAERIAALRTAVEASKAPLNETLSALANKGVTSDQFERARAELIKQEKLLAEGAELEKHDGELGMQMVDVKTAYDKGKAFLDQRWIEVGAPLQKPALEVAVRNTTQAVNNAKQKSATEDTVAKAEAQVATLGHIIARGASLETTDPKYATYVVSVKPQVPALEKSVVEARAALAIRAQAAALAKARTAAEQAMVALRKTTEEAAFEAVDDKLAEVTESLTAGKAMETDAEYAKLVAATKTWLDTTGPEITTHRTRQTIEAHKVAVEAARKAATEAAAPLA